MLNLSDGAIDIFPGESDGAADVSVDSSDGAVRRSVNKGKVEWNDVQSYHYSTELRDLLDRCLSFDPNERPDFPELVRKIREYEPDFQAGLREEPAANEFWDRYLLMPDIIAVVRLRHICSRSLKIY
jgi:serine/threonine protein kinase